MQRLSCLLLLVLFSSSGCMTFNGAELPRRELPKNAERRPLVSTEVGKITLLFNGKSGLKPPMSAKGIGNRALTAVLTRWKGRKLISDYDPPGKLDGEADYHLEISGTQDELGSIFGSIVTGATLFLFPSSSTLDWKWKFDLTNLSTDEVYSVETKNSVTQWMHLIFLPALPFSFVGTFNADSSLSAFVYSEFQDQGAWTGSDEPAGPSSESD